MPMVPGLGGWGVGPQKNLWSWVYSDQFWHIGWNQCHEQLPFGDVQIHKPIHCHIGDTNLTTWGKHIKNSRVKNVRTRINKPGLLKDTRWFRTTFTTLDMEWSAPSPWLSRHRARHHRWLGRDRKSNGAPAGFAPQDAGTRSVREFAVACCGWVQLKLGMVVQCYTMLRFVSSGHWHEIHLKYLETSDFLELGEFWNYTLLPCQYPTNICQYLKLGPSNDSLTEFRRIRPQDLSGDDVSHAHFAEGPEDQHPFGYSQPWSW